ncbi:ribonuclease H-like domain-containing protein [Tanacetum coccineum]
MAKQDTPPPTITAIKIPIIKKGEYDIWSMTMRQYTCHTYHNLWDVIVNGDLEEEDAPSREQSAPPAPKTAKQLAAKRNQERVKSILLLAIPDEYLLKFHNVLDVKSLWAAIKSRFGVSKEDINQKFLRSLPASWSQIALIMRNKPDIDQNTSSTNEVSTTDGNFGANTAGRSSSSNQVSSTPGADKVVCSFFAHQATSPPLDNEDLQQIDQDDLEDLDIRQQVAMLTVRVQRFVKKTGRNLDFKGKQPVTFDKSKVECYNCQRKGHFAKECRSGRNQGKRSNDDNGRRNATSNEPSSQALNYDSEREKHSRARLEIQGYELALESLESRILGHEKNELAWGEKYEFQNYELKCRELKIDNLKMELEKVVKERDELKVKIEKWEESSKGLNKLLNSQMSAKDKNGLGYGTQLDEISNKSETDSEISMSVFEVRSSDEETTLENDRFSKADRYHVVPPPITGNFLTQRADISFAGLDEYAIRNKIIESKITELIY